MIHGKHNTPYLPGPWKVSSGSQFVIIRHAKESATEESLLWHVGSISPNLPEGDRADDAMPVRFATALLVSRCPEMFETLERIYAAILQLQEDGKTNKDAVDGLCQSLQEAAAIVNSYNTETGSQVGVTSESHVAKDAIDGLRELLLGTYRSKKSLVEIFEEEFERGGER